MITSIWFETHSTTVDNETGIATGWLPGELSSLGLERAAALGKRIRDRGPDAIYTSDLARAVQTATIALKSADLEVPVLLDWRLRECDYGRLNGAPSAQVHSDRLRHLTDPYPGGESWLQAIERTATAVRDAAARHPGGTIMIIGHRATEFGVRYACGGTDSPAAMITESSSWQPGRRYEIEV